MSVDVKQREWIWEFFLKKCNDARMIQELMNGLPFPDENMDLTRMLLLKSLSFQVSAGMVDELTLDILKGLGYLERVSEVTWRERLAENSSFQDVAKRRKLSENESNDDEGTNTSTPELKDGSATQSNLEQRTEFSKDAVPAELVVGIRDWMKGRALPRSLGPRGNPVLETLSKRNTEAGNAFTTATSDVTGSLPENHLFSPDQSQKLCEVELAVMLELAVKHLRGKSPDRESFESAVTKYWGDSSDDLKGVGWVAIPGMVTARDQIKIELRKVWDYPERLDSVAQKYTKTRVENLLKFYLEKAWAAIGQTFLERVSADVMNGNYKPVNCNGQWSKKLESRSAEGDADQQNIFNSEKPWIRASRGRYSKSREKLEKGGALRNRDYGDDTGGATAKLPHDHRARDGEEKRAEDAGEGSYQLDRHGGDEDGVNLKNKMLDGGEIRPSLSTKGGFEINGNSLRFDASLARVLEFEYPNCQEIQDGEQQCQEREDIVRADREATEAEHRSHQTNGSGTINYGGNDMDVTGGSPMLCAPDLAITPEDFHATELSEDEKRMKEAGSPENTDLRDSEPGSPHEVINKENIVPQPSPKPTDSNPTVFFSLPPWDGSTAGPGAEGIAPSMRRKKRHGSIQEEEDAAPRKEESSSVEAAAPTSSNQSPATMSTQRNLRRKQRVLYAVVQDPLPKILNTSRSKGSLLERNPTARTIEWDDDDDDDDIEDSPSSSPSASRHVRLPHPATEKKISPLVGPKTSGIMNATHARRKPRRWSEKEVESLKREVGKYGKGRWKLILEKNVDTFHGRTEVDLKDKWRNLERFEGIRG